MVKKVTFDPRPTVYVQYVWQFAYKQARKSVWEQYGRDRDLRHRERVFSSLYP